MIARCHNPDWINYADYGGAGVSVCDRWRYGDGTAGGFECFIADMGDKPRPDLTLDRIDSTKGYSPENCRWATRTEQSRNRKSNRWVEYNGERMLLIDALKASGVSESGFYGRVAGGMSEVDALAIGPGHASKPRTQRQLQGR